MSCADHFARWHSHWDQKLVLHVFRPIRTEFLLHLTGTAKKTYSQESGARPYVRIMQAVRMNWIRRAFVHIYNAYLCIRRCYVVLSCDAEDRARFRRIRNEIPRFRHLRVSLKHFIDKTPKFLVKSLRWMSLSFINKKWIIADVSLTAAEANNFRNPIGMRHAFTFIYFRHICSWISWHLTNKAGSIFCVLRT